MSLPIPCDEDEAVAKERRRVMTSDSDEDLLVLRNLTKVYGSRWSSQYRLAVNQLCLRMKKAEVRTFQCTVQIFIEVAFSVSGY